MRKLLFIALVILIVALTACSSKETTEINDTNTTEKVVDEAEVLEPIEEVKEEPKEIEVKEIETIKLKDPGETLTIVVGDVQLETPSFGKSEEYELKMFMSKTQHDNLQVATLSFVAECEQEPVMRVVLNDDELMYEPITCKKTTNVDLPAKKFEEGQNTIELQNDVVEEYYMDDVVITLQYNDNRTEVLEGEGNMFEPAKTTPVVLKTVTGGSMSNRIEKTLKVKESQLDIPLYLSIDVYVKAGTLLVILNGKEIYVAEEDDTIRLKLPKEYLIAGDNELVFVGLEE